MYFKVLSGLVLAQLAVAQYDYGGTDTTATAASAAPASAPSAPASTDGHINVRPNFFLTFSSADFLSD